MVEIKQLAGVMDTDSSNDNISPAFHKRARNVLFRGIGKAYRPQGVPGTRLISNSLLPAGSNQSIGGWYDSLRQRIICFNYNSNGNHGIYQYILITKTFSRIIEVGVNTDGDILDFTLDQLICNVNILYGDGIRGDYLYFLNCQKQPCAFSIDRALAGTYGTIMRSYLDVIKAPPIIPPAVVYGDVFGATVNNLRKRLFKFKQRNKYGNTEKSVTSAQSEVPLPVNYLDTDIDADPEKNCAIYIVIITGSGDVKEIEILASQSGISTTDNVSSASFGDFFLVQTLNKADLGLADNAVYKFRFLNDQAYTFIDIEESIQLFDWVPLEANAQELLNGNIPIYAGILEGYDLFPITAVTSVTTTGGANSNQNFIFLANQDGDSGFGTGGITICCLGVINLNDSFTVQTTNYTYTFTSVVTAAGVLVSFESNMVLDGWTTVQSTDGEKIIMFKSGEVLLRTNAVLGADISVLNSYAWDWNSKYALGRVYFDKDGRTNGVVTNLTMPISTPAYSETGGEPDVPVLTLSVSSRPPTWAAYSHIVRTKNLTKSKTFYWITDRTFKDDKYAYFSIENIKEFREENPEASVGYSFAPQDRVCFVKNMGDGTIFLNKDFEILAELVDPVVEGITRTGTYLKIALPTTGGSFDFGGAFSNLFINLYTPAKSVSEGLDFYYEFGERYSIGNAGTANAFHQGQSQNQSSNLLTPALYSFSKGDDYYRERLIDVGADIDYVVTSGSGSDSNAGRITVGLTFQDATYSDPNIITGNSPLQNIIGFDPATNGDRVILRIISGSYTFRIRGAITITFPDNRPSDYYTIFLQKNNYDIITLVPEFDSSQAGTYTFQVDTYFTITSAERLFILGWSVPDFDHTRSFTQTSLEITQDITFTQGVIDQNFSDYYASAVNSNGRAWVVDPNQAQVYNPVLFRWGREYLPSTNINNANRFYPQNNTEADRQRGDVRRLAIHEQELRVFQARACARTGIYMKAIQNAVGGSQLITTDEVITNKNFDYLLDAYGMDDRPEALISAANVDYFFCTTRGCMVRWSRDGLSNLNMLYKGEYEIGPMITQYAEPWVRPQGGYSKILGAFDFLNKEAVFIMQAGTSGANSIPEEALSFNEKRNGFSSFFDLPAEILVAALNTVYAFKDGQLYARDDEQNNANVFGVQYYPSITLVFNSNIAIKKVFEAVAYQSNQIWVSDVNGNINTSLINGQTGSRQESQLIAQDYEVTDDIRYAALLRDKNSMADAQLALVEGDVLNGNWCEVKFTYKGAEFSYIYLPYLVSQSNPKNA